MALDDHTWRRWAVIRIPRWGDELHGIAIWGEPGRSRGAGEPIKSGSQLFRMVAARRLADVCNPMKIGMLLGYEATHSGASKLASCGQSVLLESVPARCCGMESMLEKGMRA